MSINFQGLDPILLLKSKFNIPITATEGAHPILKISGLINQQGPTLDYAVKLPVSFETSHPPIIMMVGCGGTGSHLLPNLLQYVGSKWLKTRANPPHIILVDGDVVEQKNLIRQRFSPQDLGMNKAEALAARYSAVFGLKISAVSKYLESSADIERLTSPHPIAPVIIIGAVDNHRARSIIWDYYLGTRKSVFWVDTGNATWHGQAILGARNFVNKTFDSHWSSAGIGAPISPVDLPCFFDEVPSDFLAIGGTPPTPQNECAIQAEADPQTIQANMLSAQCGAALVTQILEGTIRTMSMNFDALTGQVQAKVLTRQNIARGLELQKTSRKALVAFITAMCEWGPKKVGPDTYFPGVFGVRAGVAKRFYIEGQ